MSCSFLKGAYNYKEKLMQERLYSNQKATVEGEKLLHCASLTAGT